MKGILTLFNILGSIFCASPFGYRHGDADQEHFNSTSTTSPPSSSSTTRTSAGGVRRLKFQDSSTFFSSYYFKANNSDEDDIDQEEEDVRVDTVMIDSSNPFSFIGNETKYIKISSSIEIPESESLILIMDAMKLLWSAGMESIKKGFFPTLERVRRDASVEDTKRGFILDWIIDIIGAIINRQECSQKVACRAGRLAKDKMPGVQMIVMMMETFVPPGLRSWFTIVKNSVMSIYDECSSSFMCDFSDVQQQI